jgi:exodeoxyribonuclease I
MKRVTIMAHTYLFYDIETTGLNPVFDQILQFAAVRTDLQFNELERHEFHVKRRADVVPSPMALLTHGISPNDLPDVENEVDVVKKIHALFNTPQTISLGYNTLGFDDEFLRFAFYRNLLPPYTHQYANNCYRMDIFPLTILYYLYGTSDINWPQKDGRVSLKLENLNKENHLAQGAAHDAMVDVLATIALAKLLSKNETMWGFLCGYFEKQTDIARLKQLPYAFPDTHHQQGLVFNNAFGYKQHLQSLALCLGTHRHYKNQQCWLRLDLPELCETQIDQLEKTTWVIRKKLGDTPIILPTHDRFMKHLNEKRLNIIKKNKSFLEKNPATLTAITNHYLDYTYPLVPQADVDSVLYQTGFLSRQDQKRCEQFHQAPLTEKQMLINDFESCETQELAIRLIGRNYLCDNPNALKGKHLETYQHYLDTLKTNPEKIIDYRNKPKYSTQDAFNEIADIRENKTLDAKQNKLLDQLEQVLRHGL